jgi:deoxycytidylate deaminase
MECLQRLGFTTSANSLSILKKCKSFRKTGAKLVPDRKLVGTGTAATPRAFGLQDKSDSLWKKLIVLVLL